MKDIENFEERAEHLVREISKHAELRDCLLREVSSLVQDHSDLEGSFSQINEVRYQKLPFYVERSASLAHSAESSANFSQRSSIAVKRLDRLLSRVRQTREIAELMMQRDRNVKLVCAALESEDLDALVQMISTYDEAHDRLLKFCHHKTNTKKERVSQAKADEQVLSHIAVSSAEATDTTRTTSPSLAILANSNAADQHEHPSFSDFIERARQETRAKLLIIIREATLTNNKGKIMETVCHLKKLNFGPEGLEVYCKWIITHTIVAIEKMVDEELRKMDDPTEIALSHLRLVSQILDTVAATFEAEEKFLRDTFGSEAPLLLLTQLHNRSTTQCVLVMQDFVNRRRHILSMMEHRPQNPSLLTLRSHHNMYRDSEQGNQPSISSDSSSQVEEVDVIRGPLGENHSISHTITPSHARQVDQMLEETSHLVSCCQIYLFFVQAKLGDANNVEGAKINENKKFSSTAENHPADSNQDVLLNAMHDILSFYVPLQTYYFEVAFRQAMQLQASSVKEFFQSLESKLSLCGLETGATESPLSSHELYGSPTSIMSRLSSIYKSAAFFRESHDRRSKQRNKEDLYFLHGGKISLVDDVFFFLRIAIHRSFNTNSTQIISAVTILATEIIQTRLIPQIKSHAALSETYLKSLVIFPTSGDFSDIEFSRIPSLPPLPPSPLKWLGAAQQTSEYCRRMAQELCLLTNDSNSSERFRSFNGRDILRFKELAHNIDIVANEIDDVLIRKDFLVKNSQACWQAVMVPTHIDRLDAQPYNISEDTFYQYELKDPWMQACLEDWNTMLDYVGEHLTPVMFHSLLVLVATHTVNFIRFIIARKKFNSFGALQFDKDVRALRSFFTLRSYEVSLRDVFAPLSLTSTLLLCDSPRDALEEMHNLSLTAIEKKHVLMARIDFSKEEILSLDL